MSDEGRLLRRRSILGWGGAAGLLAALPGEPGGPLAGIRPAGDVPISFFRIIYRREDQLALRIDGVNLKLYKAGEPGPGPVSTARLARIVPSDPETYLIVWFGPQNLAEHAFLEPDDVTTPRDTPRRSARVRVDGSRLSPGSSPSPIAARNAPVSCSCSGRSVERDSTIGTMRRSGIRTQPVQARPPVRRLRRAWPADNRHTTGHFDHDLTADAENRGGAQAT